MRIITLTILLSLASLLFSAPASGDSLFDEEGCDLFTIDTASDLGDLVTIIIRESTQASNRTTTETEKKLNTDGELTVEGFLQWVADLPPVISPIENLTFTPSESFSGEGSVSTSGAFRTLVTATVVDELPNGNLVIEGVRDVQLSEDTATLIITGVIDPRDVATDNTILSSQIADMKIIYEGTGIIAERQRDGILSRIFNFFF